MSNGDVLWAWVAGVLISLGLLFALSRQDKLTESTVQNDMFTHEVTLGEHHRALGAREREARNRDDWERTGATPPRHDTGVFTEELFGTLDLMERVVPITPPIDSLGDAPANGTPAVAEDPSMQRTRKTPP